VKFWQKIYLFSTVVFIVVFNAASVMVIERSHTRMLEQEINSALVQNRNIHSTVDAIVPIIRIYDSINYEQAVITRVAKEFVSKNNEVYLDIQAEDHRVIYSNVNFDMPKQREELQQLAANEIRYILRDIGDRTILFTANMTELDHVPYIFTYMTDVTAVYKDRVEQYQFFVKVDIAALFLYMIIMFFVSRGLTRSIDRLNQSAQVIAQGGFSERVNLNSRDEIGILARNFNAMAEVVEDKITDLEQHNQEKQRFINNFTHELKTPLTSIIAYTNFLRTAKVTEEMLIDSLNVIYMEGKRLESLSTKLRDLLTLQENHFQMEVCDLGDVIAEMMPALEMLVKEKQITIQTTCEPGSIRLEKDLIKVLIFNLVDNAYKASSEQGEIHLGTSMRGSNFVLSVTDYGIGIADEHKDKIFEPFYMADKARTSSNGTGLGLAICQSVAQLHDAVMEVSSQEHVGTTVKVVFASAKDDEQGVSDDA